jgi:hypothetical protein
MTPRPKRSRQDQRAYRPCIQCAMPVLTAQTPEGQVVHLDVRQPCFVVAWSDQAAMPLAQESSAYVLHRCQSACPARPRRV